ncbi:ATP-dependent RNA helicase BRR2 [Nakaseomyces bracarensis]|uniref:ATP-dependent RNA helicase BRR2 n=1 Tax=Nakaseomyces bracarensis TaxID=273131 RepID=UPI003871E218
MSDNEGRDEKIRQLYRYDEMSNKVLQKDRRLNDTHSDPIKDAELSQPKSVKGRITLRDMGIGLSRGESTSVDDDAEKRKMMVEDTAIDDEISGSTSNLILKKSVLEMTETPTLKYTPSNNHNSEVYNNIISWCCKLLGDDLPEEILLGIVDIIICEIKENEKDMNSKQLREKTENELSMDISETQFHEILQLVNDINDFETDLNSIDTAERIVNVLSEEENDEVSTTLSPNVNFPNSVEISNGYDINQNVITDIFENPESIKMKGNLSLNELNNSPEECTRDKIKEILFRYTNNINIDECCSRIIDISALEDARFVTIIHDILEQKSAANLINFFIENKSTIFWVNKFLDSTGDDRKTILEKIADSGYHDIVKFLQKIQEQNRLKRTRESDYEDDMLNDERIKKRSNETLSKTDLENIAKTFMIESFSNVEKVTLPEGSFKRVKENYEEIHIPAPSKPTFDIDLVEIKNMPLWAQKAFPTDEMSTLNYIQSKVYEKAFNDSENLLMCAPTGAGKTNVAILTILKALNDVRDGNELFHLKKLKMVYIAPLKALVQEQVREMSRRLEDFGVNVTELTGDTSIKRKELEESHLLITTPEKWDILTRKNDETDIIKNVKLIIIDEVHLLHDQRGPVIESIVARTKVFGNFSNIPRIVALSATLPNYKDVARFLNVPVTSTFFFDSSYRPCPLSQVFCAIKDSTAAKKISSMNQTCFEKTIESLKEGHQVIIFVHSRKDTARTANFISRLAESDDKLENLFLREPNAKNILKTESKNVVNTDMKNIINKGIGIHHAGLSRNDRSLSEDLFADGILRVLVSTATLAWGVNLPAHTVIIKGTDIYSPEVGDWVRLSAQDLLQMLGRAGRPRYDTTGEGIIITNHKDLQYYLAILNQQLPIESQFLSKFVDNLNAEIALGNIKTKEDAISWITQTYFFVRLCANPDLYVPEKCKNNPDSKSYYNLRKMLVETALEILTEKLLIYVDKSHHRLKHTKLGQIASHFYISYNSISEYFKKIHEKCTQADILRIFSESEEFKFVTCKREEQNELKELFNKAPIPIAGSLDEPSAKINVLLQAYISRITLDGFALSTDMIFVTQNAGRLLAAMREICLSKKYALPSKITIELSKSIGLRMWSISTPLRQFPNCPKEIIKRVEVSTMPWSHYISLSTPGDVGKAIRSEKYGKLIYDLLKRYPKMKATCVTQPITPSLLLLQLEILWDFLWDRKLHGFAEPFTLLVEDIDGEKVLYHQKFLLRPHEVNKELPFTIPILLQAEEKKRLPPNFFVSIISENWLQCALSVPVNLQHIKVPKKFPNKYDLPLSQIQPKDKLPENVRKWFGFTVFNNIQNVLFDPLYNTNENLLLCAAAKSGKSTIAELAILSHFEQGKGRAVYVSNTPDDINILEKLWREKISSFNDKIEVNKLGADFIKNIKIFSESHLILASPEQLEYITRRWRQKKGVVNIELVIYDDMQHIGQGYSGITYEILVSRLNFMFIQLEKSCRQIGITRSLANPSDVAGWLNVSKEMTFNFDCTNNNCAADINIFPFSNIIQNDFTKSMLLKAKEITLNCVTTNNKTMIVLNSKRGVLNFADEIQNALNSHDIPANQDDNLVDIIPNQLVKRYATAGVGVLFEGLDEKSQEMVSTLYKMNHINVFIVMRSCYPSNAITDHIIILGTNYFDYVEDSIYHYSVNEIMNIITVPTAKKVTILTDEARQTLYKKFLVDGLPLESFLYQDLLKFFLVELSINTIKTKQDCLDMLTYTYFYRRIHNNPSYYGLSDSSSLSISAFLTEIVENNITELRANNLVELSKKEDSDENIIKISPISKIGLHHNLVIQTLEYFLENLNNNITMSDMINIICNAEEFASLFRFHDGLNSIKRLATKLPLKFPTSVEDNPLAFKCFVLLQSHFSRIPVPEEFRPVQQKFLSICLKIVNCMVDILASFGYLNAMNAMDISQMIVQGLWDIDSPLKQIPFFENKMIENCKSKNVESVYDVMEMEDNDRDTLLDFSERELIDIADFVNNYPNIEISYDFDDTFIEKEELYSMKVKLFRDDIPDDLYVQSKSFDDLKYEQWWIIIGESTNRSLYAIKKVILDKNEQEFDMTFSINESGHHNISIWAVCDSYLDVDKEVTFELECK